MNTKKIYKQAAIVLLFFSLISSFFYPKIIPLSIIAGGAVALINFRGMIKGLSGLLKPEKVIASRLVILNLFRLLMVFGVLFMLMYLRIVNGLGLLVGLTIVFIIILKEGWVYAKNV
jgi:hypothetical protein